MVECLYLTHSVNRVRFLGWHSDRVHQRMDARYLTLSSSSYQVTFSSLNFISGSASRYGGGIYINGGSYISTSTLSFSSLSFTLCSATNGGKGVCIVGSSLSSFTEYGNSSNLVALLVFWRNTYGIVFIEDCSICYQVHLMDIKPLCLYQNHLLEWRYPCVNGVTCHVKRSGHRTSQSIRSNSFSVSIVLFFKVLWTLVKTCYINTHLSSRISWEMQYYSREFSSAL